MAKKKQTKGRGGKRKNKTKANRTTVNNTANSQPSKTSVSNPTTRRRSGTWRGCIFIPSSWERKLHRQEQDAAYAEGIARLHQLTTTIENRIDDTSKSFAMILEANSDEEWWAGVGTGIKTVPIDPEQQELQDELEAQAAMKTDLLRELQQADAKHAKAEAARKLQKARAAAGAAVERAQQQVRGHEAAEAAATMARHRIQHRARVFQAATAAAELARQLPNTPKDLQIISQPNKSGTEPKIATLRELAGMELGAKGIGRESRVEHYIR
ncbi:hypothetical protein ACHAWF_000706, partial [Thalassiosira exigua]